jgi:hypothetical protein
VVLATEVSKIYCNELEEIIFPEVVLAIEQALQTKLNNHAEQFYKKHQNN